MHAAVGAVAAEIKKSPSAFATRMLAAAYNAGAKYVGDFFQCMNPEAQMHAVCAVIASVNPKILVSLATKAPIAIAEIADITAAFKTATGAEMQIAHAAQDASAVHVLGDGSRIHEFDNGISVHVGEPTTPGAPALSAPATAAKLTGPRPMRALEAPKAEAPLPQGQTVGLYNRSGNQTLKYKQLVANVKPGDLLDMGDGRTFKIKRTLGQGLGSKIFETEDGMALRVPLERGRGGDYMHVLEGYAKGHKKLENSEIPIPKVDWSRSVPNRYIVAEKITGIKFDMKDFIHKTPSELGMTDAEYAKINSSLTDFARKIYKFRHIEDMHAGQIVWSDRGWLMMDWDKKALRATPKRDYTRTIFDGEEFDESVESPRARQRVNELSSTVLEERKKQFFAAPDDVSFEP